MAYNIFVCIFVRISIERKVIITHKRFFIHRRFERELKIITLHFKSSLVGKNKEANQLLLL
jgi:hypothetical protein